MWIVRTLFLAVVVIAFLAFLTYNIDPGQKIDVNLIYASYLDVPLITVVFWSFLIGVLTMAGLMGVSYLRQSFDLQSAERRIRALESEAAILRNRTIEEAAGLFVPSPAREQRGMFSEEI